MSTALTAELTAQSLVELLPVLATDQGSYETSSS